MTWQHQVASQFPTATFITDLHMHCAPETTHYSYSPDGLNSTNSSQAYAPPPRAHFAQHFRSDIRKAHPSVLFLEDEILASGLQQDDVYEGYDRCEFEEEEDQDSFSFTTPPSSPPLEEHFHYDYILEEDVEEEDGMISPLELPPRLVSFQVAGCVTSGSVLLGSEATLDLENLENFDHRLELVQAERVAECSEAPAPPNPSDRRLESIARMERLNTVGLLDTFFQYASTVRA